ncbi:SAM-dependent methyltransferase, partial [Mycobacterium sp. ITM-2017-0098]
ALSDAGRGFGPEVSEATIRGAFEGTGWEIEDLATVTYRGVVTQVHADQLKLAVGTRVDEPAWLARVRRR